MRGTERKKVRYIIEKKKKIRRERMKLGGVYCI